jgi:LPS-assembly lipoprotein
MRRSIVRPFSQMALLFAALALGACGFRPLYATGPSGVGPAAILSNIYVEPIPERVGYQLRNQVLDRLGATGAENGAVYRLKITLREENQGVAIRPNTSITRYNYRLLAHYDLFRSGDTAAVKSGDISALAAYNVATSPFATVVAEEDASERAAGDIAERLRIELAVFFSASASLQ